MGKARLLVVEDDIDIGNMLKIYFSGMDFDVDVAMRGSDALEKTKHVLPHLIVLDIMLPDIDGYEVCRNLRTNLRTSHIPVIFLTQKDERSDKLQGLELGADDYITKPFSPRELVSRVKAVIRRTEGASGSMHDIIEVDDRLKIDFDRREVWVEGKLVQLRPTEYRLLYHLVLEACLRNYSHRIRCLVEVREPHRGSNAESRALAQAHPGFGDDAENSF